MQKAEKPPPKSPRKKNAVVSSLAKKLLVTDHASNKQKRTAKTRNGDG